MYISIRTIDNGFTVSYSKRDDFHHLGPNGRVAIERYYPTEQAIKDDILTILKEASE